MSARDPHILIAETGISGVRAQTLGGSHLAHLLFYTKYLTISVVNGLCSAFPQFL